MTYSETANYLIASSFYWRTYELIGLTDFSGDNTQYLNEHDFQFQTLALLEICPKRSYKFKPNDIFDENYVQYEEKLETDSDLKPSFTPFIAYKSNQKEYSRHAYQHLLELAHDI